MGHRHDLGHRPTEKLRKTVGKLAGACAICWAQGACMSFSLALGPSLVSLREPDVARERIQRTFLLIFYDALGTLGAWVSPSHLLTCPLLWLSWASHGSKPRNRQQLGLEGSSEATDSRSRVSQPCMSSPKAPWLIPVTISLSSALCLSFSISKKNFWYPPKPGRLRGQEGLELSNRTSEMAQWVNKGTCHQA